MFPPEQAQQLQICSWWTFFFPSPFLNCHSCCCFTFSYNHAFKVSCNLSHSPLLPSYHWLDYLPYVPAQKNVYIVRELITCCCHLLSCHSSAARSADISLLEMDSLQLRGQVNGCELNIERMFRISYVHMWPTTGCRMNARVQGTYIINALHTVDCCIMTLLMHKGSDLCSEMLRFLSVIYLCAQYSTRIEF